MEIDTPRLEGGGYWRGGAQGNFRGGWGNSNRRGGQDGFFQRTNTSFIRFRNSWGYSGPRYRRGGAPVSQWSNWGSPRGASQPRRRVGRGGTSGGFRGKRGSSSWRGGRGRGGGGGGRGGRLSSSALDAQLDAYMGEDATKARLDTQLEMYFSGNELKKSEQMNGEVVPMDTSRPSIL